MNGRRGAHRISRRVALGALPAVALAACTPRPATESGSVIPPKPRPATPDEAIKVLADGSARFAARTPEIRSTAEIDRLWGGGIEAGQEPFATVLGCSDSRLAPEIIFDQFVGDVFVVREAGNIAYSPTNIGSLEYGQAVLGSKVLVVLGHSDCGAVKAAFDNAAFDKAGVGGAVVSVVDAIKPGIAGASGLDDAIVRNVGAVIDRVRTISPTLRAAELSGGFRIVGAFYDIATARVRFL